MKILTQLQKSNLPNFVNVIVCAIVFISIIISVKIATELMRI